MRYLLNYTLLMLSTVLMVKAYNRDRTYPASRRNSKPHDLNADRTRGMVPSDFSAEISHKAHFRSNADLSEDASRRPENDQQNRYSSQESRENHPKVFVERNRGPHFDSEASVDSSDLTKYPYNKATHNNDRNYEDNYPERQSQPAYKDNTPRGKYKVQMESQDPQNMRYSPNVEADRSRGYDRPASDDGRNPRYESTNTDDRGRQHSGYVESDEKSRRRVRYSPHSAEYPEDNPQEKTYLKGSEKNFQSQSPLPGPAVNPPDSNEQYYAQQRPQYDQIPHQNENRQSPPKESSKYPEYQTENVPPPNSNYRDVSDPEQSHMSGDRGSHISHPHGPETTYYDQHDIDHKSSLRQPSRPTKPVQEELSSNKDRRPVHQQSPRNAMRVVETKKDMQPAPSEADSQISEEHDGFLDMGAYTDKKGSFGWYADFPVGKEHDKVTYSFS